MEKIKYDPWRTLGELYGFYMLLCLYEDYKTLGAK